MKTLLGKKAALFFDKFQSEVEKLEGAHEFIRYRQLLARNAINVMAIDSSSFFVFKQTGGTLHIYMAIGIAGTIDKINSLKNASNKLGFDTVRIQTLSASTQRLYKRYGFEVVAEKDNRTTMVLKL